jgi:hypothetical protein
MQLARAAAARTLANLAEPEQPQAAETQSIQAAATHSDQEAAPQSNPASTRRHATARTPSTASYKPIDPALLFTRLAAIVRDCIALEARLTAGARPTTRATSPQPPADPRRTQVCELFDRVIENHPDRPELRLETTTRLDAKLAADPHQTLGVGNFFFDICDELGIELDYPSLSHELMFSYVEATGPSEAVRRAIDPRATSPP